MIINKISDERARSYLHYQFMEIDKYLDIWDGCHEKAREALKISAIVLCQNGYKKLAEEIAKDNHMNPVLGIGTCGILTEHYSDLLNACWRWTDEG